MTDGLTFEDSVQLAMKKIRQITQQIENDTFPDAFRQKATLCSNQSDR